MYPVIKLGPVQFSTYLLMALIGFIGAAFVYKKNANKYQIKTDDFIFSFIYGLLGVVIGAKLLYALTWIPKVITHWSVFEEHTLETLNLMFGGYVFYGGLIGAIIGVALYCRRYHLNHKIFWDAMAPSIPLMHMFGRIGCLLAGCCYGKPYHGPFAITFPDSDITEHMGNIPRVPTQLMEAIFNLCLFLVLYTYQKKRPYPGKIIGVYLVSYPVMRFFIEFLRGDTIRGIFFGLSTSQWISIVLFPIGVKLLCSRNVKTSKESLG